MPKQTTTSTFLKAYEKELKEIKARAVKLKDLIKTMRKLDSNKIKKEEKSKQPARADKAKDRPSSPTMNAPVNMTATIKDFLYRNENQEHTIDDVYQAIIASGIKIKSSNPKNVISTTLYRLKKTGFVQQNKNGWKMIAS